MPLSFPDEPSSAQPRVSARGRLISLANILPSAYHERLFERAEAVVIDCFQASGHQAAKMMMFCRIKA